jgi:hypothetical protein
MSPRFVIAAILSLAVMASLAACYRPHYRSGELTCGLVAPRCPSGFYCASDLTCWRNGESPGGNAVAPAAVWIGSGGAVTADSGRTLNFTASGFDTVNTVQVPGRSLTGGFVSTSTDLIGVPR